MHKLKLLSLVLGVFIFTNLSAESVQNSEIVPAASVWLHFSNVKATGNFMSDQECQNIFSGPYLFNKSHTFTTKDNVVLKLIEHEQSIQYNIVLFQGVNEVVSTNPAKPYKVFVYAADTGLLNSNTFSGVFYAKNFCSGSYYGSPQR